MKGRTLSRFGSVAVIVLSMLLLVLFQTLGRTQVGDASSIPRDDYVVSLDLYSKGDHQGAHDQFLTLAQEGNVDAKSMLGVMYFHGHGVTVDKVKAAIWFYQAARAGRPASQLVLGKLYLTGGGVMTSTEEACFWLSLAQTRGDEQVSIQAQQALDKVLPLLPQATKTGLDKRVAMWRPVMPDHETMGGS